MKSPKRISKKLRGVVLALCVSSVTLFCFAQTTSNALPPVASPAQLAAVAPVIDCAKLADADISAAVGAKVHMTSATPVTDGKPAPYCRVTGYVEPMVKFEVRLPMNGWTQRFVQTGCGGLCGNLSIHMNNAGGCYPADHGELALASTDMGHTGGMDGQFGDDYQLRIDFAYRGVHVTTLAAKALIAAFYGQPAKYSYFTGCSDGGREALMEAQRYPEDFNGIAAGAPAMNFITQNTFYHGWNALRNTGDNGKPVLTADKLPILHQAALQACDAADGLKDGLISDPLSCQFDPSVVECKPDQDEKTCLTHAQVQMARDIYAGAHDAEGDKFVLGGPMPGSELAWQGVWVPSPSDGSTISGTISTGTLKHLAYQKNPPDSYTLADLKLSRDSFTATTKLHALYDATDPDLSSFAKAGGKLILWHGLADPHISPLNSIAYYTAMNRVMGDDAVQKFARLYLFPGGAHCSGGDGPFTFALLNAIMAWVEQGTAPFAMEASHQIAAPAPGNATPSGQAQMPANAPRVDRTRPVYPYPLTAKYSGSGSIDDARNFSPGPAKSVAASRLEWMGSSFYSPHYELWCVGNGPTMTCKSNP